MDMVPPRLEKLIWTDGIHLKQYLALVATTGSPNFVFGQGINPKPLNP